MKMPKLVPLLAYLAIICLPGDWRGRGSDEGESFLQPLEISVREISDNASKFYASTCDLVETCSSPNCSRRECYPVKGQQYQCVFIQNYSICAESSDTCTWGSADYSRSIVRLPGRKTVNYTDFDEESSYLGNTICAQRELDTVFRAQKISYQNERFFHSLFFGNADGVFRLFPAREILNANCSTYDPRLRPWYLNAISVTKDVVILIDTGSTMTRDNDFFTRTSSLDTAKALTRALVQTFTAEDTFTLVAVNETGAFAQETHAISDGSNTDVGTLVNELLGGPAFAGTQVSGGGPSHFTAGFNKANITFLNSATSQSSMKIIFLFTDSNDNNGPGGQAGSESTLAALKQEGKSLFVYDLQTSAQTAWEGAACIWNSDAMSQVRIAWANPLLFLNSYFSHLARARIQANNGSTVFWAQPYISASNLGQVISVSYPAMSDDNSTLIGVALVDFQTEALSSDLLNALTGTLDSPEYEHLTRIPKISSFTDAISCSRGYGKSCPNIQPEAILPLCNGTRAATDEELRRLQCCKSSSDGQGCFAGGHHSSKHSQMLAISLGAAGGGLLLALLCIIISLFVWCRRRNRKLAALRQTSSRAHINERQSPATPELHSSEFYSCDPACAEHSLEMFSYEMLSEATDGFNERRVIGEGGFGVVFKGILGEKQVAIKKFKKPADRAKDFDAEFQILNITNHTNLVKLLGRCFRREDCFLVYELVENGDLHSWLWPPERNVSNVMESLGTKRFLTWDQRKQIARGIAQGLDYLHRGVLHSGQVYHLDVKPRNVLLESTFNPKLGDFGNSQLYKPEYTLTTVKAGTPGYMPPEVFEGCKPNSKMDVFSYGVVLLQLVSGRQIYDPEIKPSLTKWARQMAQHGHVDEMIDEDLLESVQSGSVKNLKLNCARLVKLAITCTEIDPDNRPEMVNVLAQMMRHFLSVKNRKSRASDVSEEVDYILDGTSRTSSL